MLHTLMQWWMGGQAKPVKQLDMCVAAYCRHMCMYIRTTLYILHPNALYAYMQVIQTLHYMHRATDTQTVVGYVRINHIVCTVRQHMQSTVTSV